MKQVRLLDYIKACEGKNPHFQPQCREASLRNRDPENSNYIEDDTARLQLVNYITNYGYDYHFPDGVIIHRNFGKDNTPMFKEWSWNDYRVAHCPEQMMFDQKFIDLETDQL